MRRLGGRSPLRRACASCVLAARSRSTQRSKAAGMSLDQIGVLLDDGSAGRHQVLQQHLDDLDRRMEEMRRSREMTEHAMGCRAHDIATCPRFRAGVDDVLARF
ncbi:MerR family DNA-binding protein [Microbacterium sp. MYb66]|uniref:MerR family DNA-binding protein n=1 Tax=Microbacterium sp. MYb66 TaxID=1848692 RepID=UPI00280C2774|nr:MerR family DNA-binding protein [Microbacterium sp. MYb66]